MSEQQQSQSKTAEYKYRTLLELTTTIDKETNVQAVFKSLHKLLSAIVHFDTVGMMLCTEGGESLRLVAFERGPAGPKVAIGAEAPMPGTAAGRAIEEQRVIYVREIREELAKYPGTASQAGSSELRGGYFLPISTPRTTLGVLCIGTHDQGEVSPEDLALMQAVAAHVATALESALASDAAKSYHKQLVAERDRWKLLLEINNQVASFLDVNALFRAACESLRKHFDNDYAAVWLLETDQNRLKTAAMDFPASQRFLQDVELPPVTPEQMQWMRTRQPELWTQTELQGLPDLIRDSYASEGIVEMLISPLRIANRPLGVITLGRKKAGYFRPDDIELLGQIATQISLALDNALAYEKLNASLNQIEQERLYLETEIRDEYNFENIVGKSSSLLKVLQQIQIVAPTDSTV
ncbi:MAG TPA: GAF domain-containing protein, partial [Terriglobales bacterium]|nr:GAF domain-containing protein [Terriglobales bacterium]